MTETSIQLNIRPFEPPDEAAVIDLWHRCGLVVPWNDPKTDIALKLDFQPELLLVGTLNNSVVATVMVGYEGHRGWINYLAVSPEYHDGRGRVQTPRDRLPQDQPANPHIQQGRHRLLQAPGLLRRSRDWPG